MTAAVRDETVLPGLGRELLVVDHDDIERKRVRRLLEYAGFRVADVASGEAALAILEGRPPCAILCALGAIPGAAFAFASRVRERFETIPVLFMASQADDIDVAELADAPGCSVVVWHTNDLQPVIETLVETLAKGQAPSSSRRAGASGDAPESLYSAVFDRATDLVSVLSPSGIVLQINRRWEELLGVPRKRLVGRSMTELAGVNEEQAPDAFERDVPAPASRIVSIRDRYGALRRLEMAITPLALDGEDVLLAVGRDVTGVLETKHQLATSERNYASILASFPGVLWSSLRDGRLTHMTSRAADILGRTPEEVIEESKDPELRFARFHSDDRAFVEKSIRDLFENGTPISGEARYAHADGRWIWLSVQAVLAEGEDGEPCMDGVFFDVTKRRELEAQVVHAQKLEALGHLTAAVAHDYNNVLATILATSELMLEELERSSPLAESARDIVAAAERGAVLTKQLLTASRRDAAERRNIDVNAVVRDVAAMASRILGREVTLDLSLTPDLGFVFADPGQIDQVVMNLAQNACDAMKGRGRFTVATANVEENGRRWVRLSFTDTGSGMDAPTCAKAFEPFFTTKGSKGTGLGLSTCQMIAKEHAGELRVESEVGSGTTFHLFLPRITMPFDSGRMRRAGRETVLVVEDNERIRAVTRRMLEASGYVVVTAADRGEARRIAVSVRHVDLVLCDLLLDDASAADVVADLRDVVPNARLLIMSGVQKHPLLRDASLAGAAFLDKPFVANALEDAVREALSTPTLRHRPASGARRR